VKVEKVGLSLVFAEGRFPVRSDLVFDAISHVSNRYQLCQLASKATRKLHRPNSRVPDTTNQVLGSFHTFKLRSECAVQASEARSADTRHAA
jgi:hypothetical protein